MRKISKKNSLKMKKFKQKRLKQRGGAYGNSGSNYIEDELNSNKEFIDYVVKKLRKIQNQIKSCSEESEA